MASTRRRYVGQRYGLANAGPGRTSFETANGRQRSLNRYPTVQPQLGLDHNFTVTAMVVARLNPRAPVDVDADVITSSAQLIAQPLVAARHFVRHDPTVLASALIDY